MSQEGSFLPKDYQKPINLNQFITINPEISDEAVPMDVIFVGAGPAGLAGAIELKRLIKKDQEAGGSIGDIEIGVLEKASSLGGHNLSGAVINPFVLQELFPEMKLSDFPFKGLVKGESVYVLTPGHSVKIPTPPTMKNHGNYVASICEVVKWMGEKAEEEGINILTNFPVNSLLIKDGKTIGVRTTPAGLGRDGQPGDQYMPPTDLTSRYTVVCEGTRGPLTESYFTQNNINSPSPQIFALGVKEVWKVKQPLKNVIHTMGWPLPLDAFGGSFIYPMGDNLVSIGIVVGLDYKESSLDVHSKLQALKQHPLVKPIIEGGELVEWGAKTIPEGGYHSFPEKFYGDGIMFAGDCVGMVNVPALKGIHYAMHSGVLAARSIFNALKNDLQGPDALSSYDSAIRNSFIAKDLYKVRNMRQAFKEGFFFGGAMASLMTLSNGAFPSPQPIEIEDSAEEKFPKEPEKNIGLSKVDAVYLSNNQTRDDLPTHLDAKESLPQDVVEMYVHMCPAGVYEKDENGKLVINAPNCIDCKATDVLGPRWSPREGGSGPNYTMM